MKKRKYFNIRINDFFNYIYIVEMVIKLVAFSPKGYVSDPLNVCDGFIVLTTVVEMSKIFI